MSVALARTHAQLPDDNALVLLPEAHYVSENETGLEFKPDTPIEVWGSLTERLIVAHRKLEFAIADCLNFGEQAYGEDSAQWIEELGLGKRTLQNIARIGRLVPPSRRRATVSFSHHAEVASLPAPEQEEMLDLAEEQGLTRYELRDAVREHKRSQKIQSTLHAGVQEIWRPEIWDLTTEARVALERARIDAQEPSDAYVRGWLDALKFCKAEVAFGDAWRDE